MGLLDLRITRFVVVGTAAAALLFVLCFTGRAVGLPPFASGAAAYVLAFAFAYTLQHGWTFGGQRRHAHALPRYLAVQAGCVLLSGAVSHVASMTFGWPDWAASAAATVAASAASFVLSSRWAFAPASTPST